MDWFAFLGSGAAMDSLSARVGCGTLCSVLVLFILLCIKCRRLAKRASRAEAKVARLSREAGALNDDLLQSIQGLMLTFYVVVQHVSCDQTVKQTINKAILTADRAVIEGRDRFEQLQLRPTGKDPSERSSDRHGSVP